MPKSIRGTVSRQPQGRPPATYTVQSGETLSAIAGKILGNPSRWKEIYTLNRDLIGANPNQIRAGLTLKLPLGTPAPAPAPPAATPPPAPKPANPKQDSDRDGLIDRYDAAPRQAGDKRWNQAAAEEFASFVDARTQVLREQGAEIDCADFAAKLLKDFCEAKGIPNPLEGKGTWHQYTPEKSGGLPNVEGPNYVLAGIYADNLAKNFTRRINDADGDGIRGFDATGKIDVDDLRPGDILFYDWDGNGVVNHTVNVIDISDDGTVTLAFGTYDNLRPGQPLTWENLDILPIRQLELKPGTEDYDKWLGSNNGLFGARRYNWMPDHQAESTEAPIGKPAPIADPDFPAASVPSSTPVAALDPVADPVAAPTPPPAPIPEPAQAESPKRTPGRWDNLMRILTES